MYPGFKHEKSPGIGRTKVKSYGASSFFVKKTESSQEVMKKYILPKELTSSKK